MIEIVLKVNINVYWIIITILSKLILKCFFKYTTSSCKKYIM